MCCPRWCWKTPVVFTLLLWCATGFPPCGPREAWSCGCSLCLMVTPVRAQTPGPLPFAAVLEVLPTCCWPHDGRQSALHKPSTFDSYIPLSLIYTHRDSPQATVVSSVAFLNTRWLSLAPPAPTEQELNWFWQTHSLGTICVTTEFQIFKFLKPMLLLLKLLCHCIVNVLFFCLFFN